MASNKGNFKEGLSSILYESVGSVSDAPTEAYRENREMGDVKFDTMANPAYVSKHAHSNKQ